MGTLWTGRILSILLILFLLFDAISKIVPERHTIEACAYLGWPAETLRGLGITLLVSTILYSLRRTSFLGAVMLTAYLGGATAVQLRIGGSLIFSIIFGILLWVGLFLRDAPLRNGVMQQSGKGW